MSAVRTQIYLTADQRGRIDRLVARDGVTLAEVVRQALERYLDDAGVDEAAALDDTFGVDPRITAPDRDEWLRG